ncbi:IclR family transcriptional regulator [Verticiella sediminum]|nr:IclR family transcriptional regulator [Verticiella sediminum]
MSASPVPPVRSSRSATRESGTFIRDTSGSRALERGLQILLAFRPGIVLLGNADLADRTALPRPTVSRLTHSLVEHGFLDYDIAAQGYRLSPMFLSLAHAFRQTEEALESVFKLMQELATREGVNVGLALPNQLEMVYLESLRESRRGVFRRAASGSRFPMESTSGGRAYLAALSPTQRSAVLRQIEPKYGRKWRDINRQIKDAVRHIGEHGYCVAHWQPGMTAVGTPLLRRDGRIYSLSISFHSTEHLAESIRRNGDLLLKLKNDIQGVWHA